MNVVYISNQKIAKMKAAKKQTKPKSGKEQTGENDSIARIPTFFKPVAKKFAINENGPKEKSDNGDKSFYVGVLKEKLRRKFFYLLLEELVVFILFANNLKLFLFRYKGNRFDEVARVEEEEKNSDEVPGPAGPQCESGSVSLFNCSECVQKDNVVISEWKQKYKDSMKLYNKQSVHFSELYSKYKDLLKTVECINKPATEAAESSDIFTANEVKYLQCMDLAKNNDCTFVHHCLKFAYKQDLSVMVSRTLWGTASSTQTSKNGTFCKGPTYTGKSSTH